MLDTNVVAALARQPQGPAAVRLGEVGEANVSISLIVACEVRFGLEKSGSSRLRSQVELVLAALTVLPLEPPVDQHYAVIRHALESAGTPIGPNDMLIAAHALATGATLVTDNVREFSRVPNLQIENWLAARLSNGSYLDSGKNPEE